MSSVEKSEVKGKQDWTERRKSWMKNEMKRQWNAKKNNEWETQRKTKIKISCHGRILLIIWHQRPWHLLRDYFHRIYCWIESRWRKNAMAQESNIFQRDPEPRTLITGINKSYKSYCLRNSWFSCELFLCDLLSCE